MRRIALQVSRLLNLPPEDRRIWGEAFRKGATFLAEIDRLAIADFENGDIWDEGLGDA